MTRDVLAEARALPLMGRSDSWNGYGQRPLGDCPDTVLRQARAFFRKILREGSSQRVEEQLEAIALVLEDREANSPQCALDLFAAEARR
jgi:hypothetical protein